MREVKVLSVIRTDGGTQARAGLDEVKVAEYAERMEAGDEFPALKVMYDGSEYWLYDGFHRHAAAIRIDRHTFLVDVQSGTQRDARRKACSVNSAHGLPRTAEDKRRAVLVFLEDEEWATYSDRKIADELKVSPTFVGKIRASLTVHVDSEEPQERKYTTKHGTEAVMRTGNIGTAPRNLADGIKANVSDSAYESILSLQNAVLTYYKPFSPQDAITLLESLKADHKNPAWSGLSLHLGRNGKIFRVADLRQAVNNSLDTLKQLRSQKVLNSGELTEAVIEFAQSYADEFGRTWADIENPSHTNGTFWQTITADFTRRGLVYNNQADLKFSIKQAYARLHMEAQIVKDGGIPVSASEPVAAAVLNEEQPASEFVAVSKLEQSVMVWYINQRRNDIPGQLALMTAILEQQFDHELWADMTLKLPAPWRPDDLHTAIKHMVAYLQERTDELCANCGRELTGPGWTSDLGGNVCDACAREHSRHAQPAPKPRIAPFVMGHFQVANEALARIYTAIPKSRQDDIHDFAALIATLERLERRIGAEYDMS